MDDDTRHTLVTIESFPDSPLVRVRSLSGRVDFLVHRDRVPPDVLRAGSAIRVTRSGRLTRWWPPLTDLDDARG